LIKQSLLSKNNLVAIDFVLKRNFVCLYNINCIDLRWKIQAILRKEG